MADSSVFAESEASGNGGKIFRGRRKLAVV